MATDSSSVVPPDMEKFIVGIIGMGDMGKMYARRLSDAGWRVMACDKEDQYESLREEFTSRVHII
ncbi:hypothetical protein F5Y00DRAFT_247879 [Daldinia vernicosa]|uniref:uncharacterized protein n=1 Tax=Daldinia vernicosa TaxID=114800 RepID=UPI002008D920|nr:uncharacterized protein F5Y00DRAFT_247879 [Daldinia vernicosa]KAI0844873.1 hypothetical protein F5Y00DRAFT_247879 [Daldinia vernicosa]